MKTALVILPACLLVLAHLSSAQMLSTDIPSIDCEQVQNLSPECTTALAQGATGADQAAAFCRGDCFQTVLSAYRSCGAAGETIAQSVQEGCGINSNGDICLALTFSSTFAQAITACALGNIGGDSQNIQCSDDCRNVIQGFGCCANTQLLGVSDFASACGISSDRCPTAGASGLHSVVGVLTSLIFAGLALMFKY